MLAIDQGTTGSTALVFGRDGQILGRAYSEFTQHFPKPGWVEHDPDEIWQVSLRVMATALAQAGLEQEAIAAIGITNQRETTVVWDRESGRPVHNAVVWQSRQTAEICERLRREGHESLFRERTGLVLDAYFSGTKIRWILDRDERLQKKAEAGELLFGTIDTWLLWKLTGGKVHKTEPTNASRTLLFDIHRRRWDDDILDILGIPRAMLPSVTSGSSEIFGETVVLSTDSSGEVPGGIPISGIAGDQQSALYGQGCWRPGQAKNTYGTGCFLLMNMGDQNALSEGGLLTTLGCDEDGQPVYCLEGSVFTAGAAVQWLRDELQLVSSAADTEGFARSIDSTDGVYVVPAFSGLGAPYWDMEARGTIVGLTRGSSRAHLIRAVLESIAYQTRDVLDVMNQDSGIPITELRVDGGAAANDFLMQFQSDITGIPVDRPAIVETTAMGAAFLAGLATGLWSAPEELAHVRRKERRFEPRMDIEQRQELYKGWKQAVRRALHR
ncbi:MAG: glycerol kinase GlpK [Thermoanaerobaculia bacterium]|nr:glycerol kinase GlpK [Thermoanaerobaculia bacterium]